MSLRSKLWMAPLATMIALAAPSAHAQPAADPAKIEQAKQHMKAGAAFYNDPSGHKCEEAIREFSQAFELSGSLNALKGMAVCNLELERDGEAIDQYTKFLAGKGASIDPGEKQQVESDLAALKSAVATVKITVDRPNVHIVDERTPSRGFKVRNEYVVAADGKSIGIHPGVHELKATADGAPDSTWKVEVANGSTVEHAFEFSKAPPPTVGGTGAGADQGPQYTRPIGLPIYIAGGATVVLLGVTIAEMLHAKSLNSDYQAENGKASAPVLNAAKSDVSKANLTADLFLAATAAGLVTTGVLYFIRPKQPISGAPATTGSITLTPAAGPGFAMGSLRASF